MERHPSGQSHEFEAFPESWGSLFGYCESIPPVNPPYIPQTYNSTFRQPHFELPQQTDHQCPLCGNYINPNVSPATYRPEVNLEPNLSDVESLLSNLTQDGNVLAPTSPLHRLSALPQFLGEMRSQQHQGTPGELLDAPTFQKANYVGTCVSPGFPINSGDDADWQNALRAPNSFPAFCTDPTLLWNSDQRFALQIDTSGTMSSASELGGSYVPPPPLTSPSSSELSTTVLTPTTWQQHQATSIKPQRILPRSSRACSPLSTYTSRISSKTDFQIDAAWPPQVSSAEGEQHSWSKRYTKVWTMSKAPQQGTAPIDSEVNRLIHASVYSRIQINPVSDVEGEAYLMSAAKRFSVLEGKILSDDVLFSVFYCSAACFLRTWF
jgi:hypothetical protein